MNKNALILSSLVFILSAGNVYACPGVDAGKVNFSHKVKFDYSKAFNKKTTVFKVKGLTNSDSVKKLRDTINNVKGVKMVSVDLKTSKANVVFNSDFDSKLISEQITKAAQKSGFKAIKV